MAKGDREDSQAAITNFGGAANAGTNASKNTANAQQQQFYGNYNKGVDTSLNSYDEIMNNYRQFLSSQYQPPGAAPANTGTLPQGQAPQGNPQGNQLQVQNGDYQGFYNSLMNGANDQASLLSHQGQLEGAGFHISPANASGAISKIQTPDGNWVRVIGEGEGHPVWLPQGGGNTGFTGQYDPSIQSSLAGYQKFADTGGFSPQDVQDLRARAIGPTRSIYSSAQANVNRQRGLQNGYAPNAIAAQAKMARDESQQISDANVNTNTSLASMIQQGKLAGLGGLSSTGLAGRGQDISMRGQDLNQALGLRGQDINSALTQRGQNLSGIEGMSSLYGASPGLASTFGNQALAANGQSLEAQNMQNQLALGLIQAQQRQNQIPSNFQQGLGNLGSLFNLGGAAANAFNGLSNMFKPGQGQSGTVGMQNGQGGNYNFVGPTEPDPRQNDPNYYGPIEQNNPQVNTSWGINPNDPYYSYYGPTEDYYGPQEDPRRDPQQGF